MFACDYNRTHMMSVSCVVFAVLFVLSVSPSMFVAEADAQTSRISYDLDGLDSQVRAQVAESVALYEQHGSAAFDDIESMTSTGGITPFVVRADNLTVVAHGASPDSVGVVAQTLHNANVSVSYIRDTLQQDNDSVWIAHIDTNTVIGQEQKKHTLLHLYDGYIFASGYFVHDSLVQQFVERHILEYDTDPEGDITAFTPDEPVITNDLYLFVIDKDKWTRAADGVRPDRVGMNETILDTSERSVDDVLSDLGENGATWVTYTFNNPATDVNQFKRTWLVLHDEKYIFGSGYYPHDSRDQSLVDHALILYSAHGTDAFGMITPDEPDPLSTRSTFVIDADNMTIVADARLPELVGSKYADLENANKPLPDIISELRAGEGVWIWHMVKNPSTQTDQLTHSYLVLYDGYIFGAGSSLPDIRVQSIIDESVYTYKNDPDAGLDVITSGALNRFDLYPAVRNDTHIVAHGVSPNFVGPISPSLQVTRSGGTTIASLQEGDTSWAHFSFFNPSAGITQIKRTWTEFHDGYVFGAPYTIADADAQSVSDYALHVYASNRENNAWKNIITPDEPIVTDDLYPFVIDLASWTRVADGVVPERIGMNETILETSGMTLEQVRNTLKEDGSLWLTYTFHNPATGVEQLKRTYLQLRDGLVFGSGYYLLDSEVQSLVFDTVLTYDSQGRNDTLALVNDITGVAPSSTYVFAVDPTSGVTLAQNVDPELVGGESDWDAILSVFTVQDILDAMGNDGGAWVSYSHTEPVTGEQEIKRTWLVLHEGIIIGSGYYTSDIPASDAKLVVYNAIRTYDAHKEHDAWVDIITPDEQLITDSLYAFVIDADTWTRAADGVVPARIGMNETILDNSGRTVQGVLEELDEKGAIWVSYTFHNPATGVEQLKRSYLQLHDGYVFGSGYYLLDSRVQAATHSLVLEYERDGKNATLAALDIIPDEPSSEYVFAVDPISGMTLAQNVDSALLQTSDWDAIVGIFDVSEILEVLERGVGMWVSYSHTEPVTGGQETKRTWLVLHEGIIIGSGYYTSDIPASDAKFAVGNAIRTYEENREDDAWIDIITADAPVTTDALYVFVIDVDTWTRAADGVLPARLGMDETILDTSPWSPESVIAELKKSGSMWVSYTFHNPATGVEQLKRSYLQLRDGYIFGSGYYVLDSQVQSAAQGRILEYERDGRDGVITSINMIHDAPFSTYTFAVDHATGTTLAQNVDPALLKMSDWDAISAALDVSEIRDTLERGVGIWVSYSHTEPVTGEQETKRTWLVLHKGVIFGSGYYTSDISASDAKFAVGNAIRTYEENQQGMAWVDIITADAPVTTDALYVFVIDVDTWTRAADGVLPARLGMNETILDTSTWSPESVIAELKKSGSMWVSYTFHNPATGVEQLKRSYLQLRDGYIFGSGYYVLDSQVQSAAQGRILEYERDGRDGVITSINMIPDTPFSTYAFAVDPYTGTTLAQNVDPALIAHTSDWDAISAALDVSEIRDTLERGVGIWVSYSHTEPVTGEQETKRTWLVLHKGIIFGSGYYTSDIQESDVMSVVRNSIQIYDANKQNDAWIDILTPDEDITTDALYVFVIDEDEWTRAADGVRPGRVGMNETILDTSDRTVNDVRDDLRENGHTWASYIFLNPATGIEQSKRSYLQLHEGYIFGSGYYILDSRVQAAVQGRVLEYERDGRATVLESVNMIPDTPSPTYEFIVDSQTGDTLAQRVDETITQRDDWAAISAEHSASDILDIISRGTGMWVHYTHIDPTTGMQETKRTWLVMHDDLVFGSGYYESEILVSTTINPIIDPNLGTGVTETPSEPVQATAPKICR